VQYEVFGPDLWQADADEGTGDAPEPGGPAPGGPAPGEHDALPPEERQGPRQVWTRRQEAGISDHA
jgi:hypothetical protein